MRKITVGAMALCTLSILAFLPVEVPYVAKGVGKALPVREWTLVRGDNGQLVSTLRDRTKSSLNGHITVGFERGDWSYFALAELLEDGSRVVRGDTLATFRSEELQRQKTQLQGELTSLLTEIALYEVGEKEAIIQEARLELELSRADLDWKNKHLRRVEALWQSQMATDVEYENALEESDLQRLQVEIDAAKLRGAETGARAEELAWRRQRAQSLRDELDLVEERLARASFVSPIAGRVSAPASGDTLIVVRDTTAYIVLLPLPWEMRTSVAMRQPVELQMRDRGQTRKGQISHIGSQAFSVNGHQFFLVKAQVEDANDLLATGLVIPCSVHMGESSLWAHIWREMGGIVEKS